MRLGVISTKKILRLKKKIRSNRSFPVHGQAHIILLTTYMLIYSILKRHKMRTTFLYQNEFSKHSFGRQINIAAVLLSLFMGNVVYAFVVVLPNHQSKQYISQQHCLYATVGIFFGTSVSLFVWHSKIVRYSEYQITTIVLNILIPDTFLIIK
jgi:hypothetical protein